MATTRITETMRRETAKTLERFRSIETCAQCRLTLRNDGRLCVDHRGEAR